MGVIQQKEKFVCETCGSASNFSEKCCGSFRMQMAGGKDDEEFICSICGHISYTPQQCCGKPMIKI